MVPFSQAVVPFSVERTKAAPWHTKNYWSTEEKDLLQNVFMTLLLDSHIIQKKIQTKTIQQKLDSIPSLASIKSKLTFDQIRDKLWALL